MSKEPTPKIPSGLFSRDGERQISLNFNAQWRTGRCEPRELLSDFIRHELGATGTHVGCEHGVCGACTVHVDGIAARSCLMLAVQLDGRRVDTIEGLAPNQTLGDLQRAFQRHHALQCGFCTAGILMSCADYLGRVADPSEQQVRQMLSGHLCRCTGYTPIVAAVLDVARSRIASGDARDVPAEPRASSEVPLA
jgi:2-furoyl-CoA dehydrogenase 2Fe-2S iron sulfur subunit